MKKYKFTHENLKKEMDIMPYITVSNQTFPSHTHDYYEMCIVLNGWCDHEFGSKIERVQTGNFYIVPPNITHAFIKMSNYKTCQIAFSNEFKSNHLKLLSNSSTFRKLFPDSSNDENNTLKNYILSAENYKACTTLCELITNEYESRNKNFDIYIVHYFQAICSLLCKQIEDTEHLDISASHFYNSVEYLEKHFKENLTIETLAKIAKVSVRHYTRIFKQKMGMTPSQYKINLRLNHAEYLLSATKMSITDVALECGYNNVNLFSRQFKQKKGIQPKMLKF